MAQTFTAEEDILESRFVVLASSTTVKTAASSTDNIIGVTDTVNTSAEDVTDVYLAGEIAYITAGGTFSAGDLLTSDSEGKAVKAASGDNVGAMALEDAEETDVIKCVITIQRELT